MRLGRAVEPRPVLRNIQRTNTTSFVTIGAALGQTVVLAESPDLRAWTPAATNVVFTNPFTVGTSSALAMGYFRAGIQ